MGTKRFYVILDVNTEKARVTSRDPVWSGRLKKTEYCVPLLVNFPKPPAQRLAQVEITTPIAETPAIAVENGTLGDADDEYEYGNPVG